jgi:hypothetical protein
MIFFSFTVNICTYLSRTYKNNFEKLSSCKITEWLILSPYFLSFTRYNFVSAKVWTKEYLGFLTFTQGVCGADFLKAISNGRVTFDAMDKQAVYDTADQHRHLGEKMVTIQFR